MNGRIVIKLGGNLITDKSSQKTIKREEIDIVSSVLAATYSEGYSLVIVHGAGSFGHLLARRWSIDTGAKPEILEEQMGAVSQIRTDMRELNSEVVSSLARNGLRSEGFPPSNWAEGTGRKFVGDLTMFERESDDVIPITFGDVVNTGDMEEFGILSGDDLMLRLSLELPDVTHSIFLLGDAGGVMDRPPDQTGARLLPSWKPLDDLASNHLPEIDVTGGINLKLARASEIAGVVGEVWFLDGREPDRVLELLRTGKTVGTKILDS
jgi:isopentenyl phosphate kinase